MLAILIALAVLSPASRSSELLRPEGAGNAGPEVSFEGWVIDSIEIDNRDIYDLTDPRYQGLLFRTANKLHLVTRDRIIRQELLFRVGDSLSETLIEETARNLRLRFPLNEAWVEIEEVSAGRVLVRVVTVDQWSLIGGLRSVSRDGNETNFRLGFEERNLIGRAQFLSFDFFARENKPNFVTLVFREPRVLGRPLTIGFHYRSDPDNGLKLGEVGRPYYSLAQRVSFEMMASTHTRLEERFDSVGEVTARWRTAGETAHLRGGFRTGPSHRKTTIHGEYKYLYKAVVDSSVPVDSTVPGADSVYHRFSFGLSHAWLIFIVEERIRGFGYTEDFVLGFSLDFEYGRAFHSGLSGYYYDQVKSEFTGRLKIGDNLIGATYDRVFWLKGTREIRRQYGLAVTLYNNHWRHVTWAVRSQYLLDRSGGDLNIILGGNNGLRGYPSEFRAGDRSHVMNFESRLFFGLELLSVKIGSALFLDLGRTWQPQETLAFRDYHFSGGGGLRLSLENLLRGEIIRFDMVFAEGGNWELSFGTGQYF